MALSKDSLFLMGITIISGASILIASVASKSEVVNVIGATGASLTLIIGFGFAFLVKE